MYVYKIYNNNHPFDTSLVWLTFFRNLLLRNYVPAIILPKDMPNPKLFSFVNSFVPSSFTSTLVDFRDNFFRELNEEGENEEGEKQSEESPLPETDADAVPAPAGGAVVESYYDNKVEKIQIGDVLLTPENILLIEFPTNETEEGSATGYIYRCVFLYQH